MMMMMNQLPLWRTNHLLMMMHERKYRIIKIMQRQPASIIVITDNSGFTF